MFDFVNRVLININSKITNTLYLKFYNSEEMSLFIYFEKLKKFPCIEVINYLKNYYKYYTKIDQKEELLLKNNESEFNPFYNAQIKGSSKIILLPN